MTGGGGMGLRITPARNSGLDLAAKLRVMASAGAECRVGADELRSIAAALDASGAAMDAARFEAGKLQALSAELQTSLNDLREARVQLDAEARAFSAFKTAGLRLIASREHVAVEFGVCEKAARNWWNGVSGANGDKVLIALARHPDGFRRHLMADFREAA